MLNQDQFHGLLLEEFPVLQPLLPEAYPPSNALMCFAWHTQKGIREGDENLLRKCFLLADRCLREGEQDLLEKFNDYFFVQLTVSDARPAADGWLRRVFGRADAKRTAEAVIACMTPAVQAAWRKAESERKGTRTEIGFIEETKIAFPDIAEQPAAVAFLCNPYIGDLLKISQMAIDSGDLATLKRVFDFLLPYLVEGIGQLRWSLFTFLLEKLEFRGPHADQARAALPGNVQEALKSIEDERERTKQAEAQAKAATDARRQANYPRIPPLYRALVEELDALTGVEFAPAPPKVLDSLRRWKLPASILEFYASANPQETAEGFGVSLLPGHAVGRTEPGGWIESVSQLHLVPFATDLSGDVYCFDLREPGQASARVVKVSHEWGCPKEGLKEFLTSKKNEPERPKELEDEYWTMYFEEAVTPFAEDFATFLGKWIQLIEKET